MKNRLRIFLLIAAAIAAPLCATPPLHAQGKAGIYSGTGSPEGKVAATAGDIYLDSGGTFYLKSQGTGKTGWIALASGNAATATALASTPTKCMANNYPLGIDASGNALNCTAAASGDTTAKYIIGATDSTLTNALVWPSLFNSPDAPPASPNAANDQFDGASLNTGLWSWTAQGSCTETQANGWASLSCPSNGSSHVLRFLGQTLPSPPYTYIAKLSGQFAPGLAWTGLVLSESGTGKSYVVGPCDQGNFFNVCFLNFPGQGFQQTDYPGLPSPAYIMINRTSTTITVSWSSDGIAYTPLLSESITTHFTTAPDTIGFGVNAYSEAAAVDLDYFIRIL